MPARPATGAAGETNTPRERRPVLTLAAIAAGAAYAGWASGTVPFTTPADVAVSLPAALMAAGLATRWAVPNSSRGRRRPTPLGAPAEAGPAAPDLAQRQGSVAPWLALVFVVVAVELASYFHGGPRTLYPTISSSVESVFRHRPVKAAAFLGWLAGGWYLVAR